MKRRTLAPTSTRAHILRRDFLRWLGIAGAAGASRMLITPAPASAAAAAWQPLYVAVYASGGWDVTMLCDPKGAPNPANQGYNTSNILTVGNFAVPPQAVNVQNFFTRYYQSMLVINGINTSTIDHDAGSRASQMGTIYTGLPTTAALMASVYGGGMSAPYMSNGGVNDTQDEVSMTQLGPGISQALQTDINPGVHRGETWTALDQLIANRYARHHVSAVASQRVARTSLLTQSYGGIADLADLSATISDLAAQVPLSDGTFDIVQPIDDAAALNIRVGLAGYVHGLTIALQLLGFGSYDSHGDNDNQQVTSLNGLMTEMDYLLRCASYLGISDHLLLSMSSDFGRTPFYNSNIPTGGGPGKDHWPITSTIIVQPAATPTIPVNRVWGGTDDGLNPINVDPTTLALVGAGAGVTIQPGHVHDALRRWLGVAQSPLASKYDLHMADTLPLLG